MRRNEWLRSRAARALVLGLLSLTGACALKVPGALQPTPDWSSVTGPCLAFSGGGLRSGAVSLGALQGLHSTGHLSRVTYISAVSGGGYPVYGLAHRLIRQDGTLADLLAEDGKHIRSADGNSAFAGGRVSQWLTAPLALFVWTPLSWFTPYSAAQPTYSAQIHQTFAGGMIGLWGHPKLSEGRVLRQRGFPMVIFGASATRGRGAPKSRDTLFAAGDYFELAADLSGSPKYGYYSGLADVLELRAAAAISGAAIDTPKGGVPDWLKTVKLGLGSTVSLSRHSGDNVAVFLSDAGFVENLGILPLLRRGCGEILAFDNSHDPRAEFGSWSNFMSRAEEEGWSLAEPLAPQAGAVVPREVDAWHLSEHFWTASLRKGDAMVKVRLVKLGIDSTNLSRYPTSVRDFAGQSWKAGISCTGSGLSEQCGFPQESTARQSYLKAEFRAYRHLGRCLARRAVGAQCDQ